MMLCEAYFDEPEALLREALDGQTRVLGPEHEDTLETMLYLAWALTPLSDESVPLTHKALEIATRTLGPDHPQVCMALLIMGSAYAGSGQWSEAETWLRRALEATRRVLL
jgi:hypothetical protein